MNIIGKLIKYKEKTYIRTKQNNLENQSRKPCGNKKKSQFRVLLFLLILIFSWTSSLFLEAKAARKTRPEAIQEGIAKEIIRFHVIANSDSTEDQTLKLEVKDKLVKLLSPRLKSVASITQARSIINNNIDLIKATAEKVIHENGYDYPVTVSLESCFFPLKIYGDYTFPPGTYEALRVRIGSAAGHNWWCVMFPPLCFVDETYCVVDKATDQKLKYLLSEEEYKTLRNKKIPVKVKFKLLKSIRKLFHA